VRPARAFGSAFEAMNEPKMVLRAGDQGAERRSSASWNWTTISMRRGEGRFPCRCDGTLRENDAGAFLSGGFDSVFENSVGMRSSRRNSAFSLRSFAVDRLSDSQLQLVKSETDLVNTVRQFRFGRSCSFVEKA
jgi:protoporphyrin/coproporphyrin ferrochelatase